MKKETIILICLVFIIFNGLCQDSDDLNKYHPKPKISTVELLLGVSTISVDGYQAKRATSTGGGGYFVSSLEMNSSISLGLGVGHKIGNHFELLARVFYDRKSFVEKLDSISLTPDNMLSSLSFVRSEQPRNDYLTLYILPQYQFGRKLRVNLGVGGYVSTLCASKTEVVQSSQPTYSYVSLLGYNKYDYGLSANLGLVYPLNSNTAITFQITASQGLSSISDFRVALNYPSWYYRSYSFTVGIRYSR